MAALITPLVSGIPAAASGTAEFYVKGTGTLSTKVYTDAAGTVAAGVSSALDAYGAVTRYATEPVDVVVKAAGGATVKTFTFQDDARLVGLESAGFNGALAGGGTGAGGFTTEHLAWGELYESVGGLDARVNSGAGNVDIKTAAPGSGSIFFVGNYGAVGDDATDDTAALQAAISACALAGGGILLFAPKTYKITAALTGVQDMLVIGHGATLKQYTNNASIFLNIKDRVTVIGLTLTVAVGVTGGTMLAAAYSGTQEKRLLLLNCVFYADGFNGTLITAGNDYVRCIGCAFRVSGGAAAKVTSSAMWFTNCRIRGSDTATLFPFSGGAPRFEGCDFYITTAMNIFSSAVNPAVVVIGGKIECTHTSGVVYGASLGGLAIAGTEIKSVSGGRFTMVKYNVFLFDSGCPVMGHVTIGAPGTTVADNSTSSAQSSYATESFSVTRRGRVFEASAVGATFTPDLATYGRIALTQTSGATLTIASPRTTHGAGSDYDSATMRDQETLLTYYNNTGGTVAVSFDSGVSGYNVFVLSGHPLNVLTGKRAIFRIVTMLVGAAASYVITDYVNGM